MAEPPRTRLSFTHERAAFRAENPIHARTTPSRAAFNDAGTAEREARRSAFHAMRRAAGMVERDRPHPVLKPSPALAGETDRQAYHAALRAERRQASSHETAAPPEAMHHPRTDPARVEPALRAAPLSDGADQTTEFNRRSARPQPRRER